MTLMEIYQHPRTALRALRAWIMRQPLLPPALPRVELPAPRPRKKLDTDARDERVEAADMAGEFYFKENILDDLDYYMLCIERMRKADREAYNLYSQLGAHILPGKMENWQDGLSAWWKVNRPGFGAVAWTRSAVDKAMEGSNKITPRFWYFMKISRFKLLRHHNIQLPPDGSDIYIVTAYWDQPRDEKWAKDKAVPSEFIIAIDANANLIALKEFGMRREHVRAKRKKWKQGQTRGHGDGALIKTKSWGIHWFFQDWAKEHNKPVEQHLRELFCAAARMYEQSNRGMIRVEARKGHNAAVFSVDIKRTPYFFKDRGVTQLTKTGQRKRIFHIVRPHIRADGAAVPMHFRGERTFDWNGFTVSITVPGLHHVPTPEFDLGAVMYDKPLHKGMPGLTMKQLGGLLKGGIEGLADAGNSMKNRMKYPPVPRD
jgi:hypothetical protein